MCTHNISQPTDMQSLFHRRKRNSSSTASTRSTFRDDLSIITNSSLGNGTPKSNKSTFRVKIPPNVRPGEQFHVYAGDRLLKIKCPANATPGRSIAITVPKEDKRARRSSQKNLHSSNVSPIPDTDPPAYNVTIPPLVSLSFTKFFCSVQI